MVNGLSYPEMVRITYGMRCQERISSSKRSCGSLEEIVSWLRGEQCDHLIVYKPMRMSFYRKAVLFAVVKATRRSDCLCLITTYEESANVTR